jgi:hypothetical protein
MIFHEHLIYYKKLPRQIWENYYMKFNKKYPDSFGCAYNKKGNEEWYIEQKLWDQLQKRTE